MARTETHLSEPRVLCRRSFLTVGNDTVFIRNSDKLQHPETPQLGQDRDTVYRQNLKRRKQASRDRAQGVSHPACPGGIWTLRPASCWAGDMEACPHRKAARCVLQVCLLAKIRGAGPGRGVVPPTGGWAEGQAEAKHRHNMKPRDLERWWVGPPH